LLPLLYVPLSGTLSFTKNLMTLMLWNNAGSRCIIVDGAPTACTPSTQ
jgi:hypothetical protein